MAFFSIYFFSALSEKNVTIYIFTICISFLLVSNYQFLSFFVLSLYLSLSPPFAFPSLHLSLHPLKNFNHAFSFLNLIVTLKYHYLIFFIVRFACHPLSLSLSLSLYTIVDKLPFYFNVRVCDRVLQMESDWLLEFRNLIGCSEYGIVIGYEIIHAGL